MRRRIMLSNATTMDPNMTAADKLSNKMGTRKKKKRGATNKRKKKLDLSALSAGVSVSTVVGAPARVKPLSPFSLISC